MDGIEDGYIEPLVPTQKCRFFDQPIQRIIESHEKIACRNHKVLTQQQFLEANKIHQFSEMANKLRRVHEHIYVYSRKLHEETLPKYSFNAVIIDTCILS